MKVPLIGICRHRLQTDGAGVTTLVAFHGCPLRCKYCLNGQCLTPDSVWREMDAYEIFEEVRVDDLYFRATGGGITFGGGEPLLRSETIVEFCQMCPPDWHISLETSLHVPKSRLAAIVPYVDHYFVDVKDCHPAIYRRYCSAGNTVVTENLKWLLTQITDDRITIRLPHIPDYNTPEDVAASRQHLEDMGLSQFDEFNYIKP